MLNAKCKLSKYNILLEEINIYYYKLYFSVFFKLVFINNVIRHKHIFITSANRTFVIYIFL